MVGKRTFENDAEDLNKMIQMGFCSIEELDDKDAKKVKIDRKAEWNIVKLAQPRPVPHIPEIINPNGPWKSLSVPIKAALQDLQFEIPTAIQSRILQEMDRGLSKQVIGSAPTGSGKTLAFSLPILQYSSVSGKPGVLAALILAPTRELALQTADHLSAAGKYLQCLKIVTVVGGMSSEKQERLLSHSPNIIIATPGRLAELVEYNQALQKALLSVPFLVIDEADRMVLDGKGRFPDLEKLFIYLGSNQGRNVFLFSATLSSDKLVSAFNALKKRLGIVKKHLSIHVDGMNDGLNEYKVCVMSEEKEKWLFKFFTQKAQGKAIIFVNSIEAVRRLFFIMSSILSNHVICPLHAQMQQRQRLKYLDRFKKCENAILISSDVAARGIDIPTVTTVVQAEPPRSVDIHKHRIGRTARAGRQGKAILLLSPKEAVQLKNDESLRTLFTGIQDYPSHFDFSGSEIAILFSIVNQMENLTYSCRRGRKETNLKKKFHDEIGIDLDDDPSSTDTLDPKVKKQIDFLKSQLSQVLKKIK